MRRMIPSLALVGLSIYFLPAQAQVNSRVQGREVDDTVMSLVQQLQVEVENLKATLELVKQDAANANAKAAESHRLLERDEAELARLSKSADSPPETTVPTADTLDARSVDEQLSLLNAKVKDQYQTKVESGSKYRVKFSGLILLNMFENRGTVDNIENPAFASEEDEFNPVHGTFGGTLRQTRLNVDVFGPTLLGARSSATAQMDFSGGFADRPGGSSMGLLRLRTGVARLTWSRTSIVAGQDGLFFLPQSPTSYASLEQPSFAYSGNLWGWTPQIRFEHSLLSFEGSDLAIQAGILDPVSAGIPSVGAGRTVSVGEQSRSPAMAVHIGWSKGLFGRKLSFGAAEYRSRQNWTAGGVTATVNSWLASADWNVPLTKYLALSGTFYRGSALGDLGGGIGQSVTFSIPPDTVIQPSSLSGKPSGLHDTGGWMQLKFTPGKRWEFNSAFGEDNPSGRQLESSTGAQSYLEGAIALARNSTAFGNVIFRPRSDLLFSAEFRYMRTIPFSFTGPADSPVSANHVNLAIGYSF